MTPHFSDAELTCKCGCGMLPKATSADRLERLRMLCGFPIKVTSGARCPKHNLAVAHSGEDGPHTKGQAFDILVNRLQAYLVVQHASEVGFTGIGVAQKGADSGRIIHVDDLPDEAGQPRPTVWSY